MTREELLKYGFEAGLLKFSEYLELTKPLKNSEGLEEAASKYAHSLGFDEEKERLEIASAKEDFIAGAEWQKEKDVAKFSASLDKNMGYVVSGNYERGRNDMKKEMMEKAVGGRYMKADGKVYVESWLLDIDPDSVKAGDEVRLIVLPEE